MSFGQFHLARVLRDPAGYWDWHKRTLHETAVVWLKDVAH